MYNHSVVVIILICVGFAFLYTAEIKFFNQMVRRSPNHVTHRSVVKVGDAVVVMYDEKEEVCRIAKVMSVRDPEALTESFWVVPVWYWSNRLLSPLRRNRLVETRGDVVGAPIPCSDVVRMVLLVHNCNRTVDRSHVPICQTEKVCNFHASQNCINCNCPGRQMKDTCDFNNPVFEVVDRTFGLVERYEAE